MRIEYFQLIDKIQSIDVEGGTITVAVNVPDESTIFEGHFPGHPLMPGVLLIESMAQTSGYLLLGLKEFGSMPFLAGVREAKLRRFVGPGTELTITAEIEHDGSGYAMTKAKIRDAEGAVADAKLTFKVMPFPDDTMKTSMRSHAKLLGYPGGVPA